MIGRRETGVREGVRAPLGAMRARWARLADKRSDRSSRGTAELSVLVAAGALVAGALFGTGLSRTSVDIGDGLTWFTDSPSGEVIQVNPATGRPETRIDVAAPGNALEVAQLPGRLFVTNRTSGQLVSFDLTSILTSGQRRVTPGAATDVLHHGNDVFLVDRERGTVAAIDPVSTDTIGEIWQSPEGIADAVLDGTGQLWSVDQKGLLTELRWSSRNGGFVTEEEREVEHSGARSVLVGHDNGVTLFGPDQGIVVQVGTGSDEEVVAGAPRLSGELEVPEFSPSSMVPVSAPETGTVAIVSDGAVHEVDVTAIGCEKPQRPEAFQGTVYVPCSGDEKVVRLDPSGARAGDDIELPEGGEPSLVMDDGTLLINVPGAEHGVSVAQDGTVSTIVRIDESLPAVSGDPADVPTIDPGTIDSVANADTGGVVPSTSPPVTPQTPPVCVGKKKQCNPPQSPTPDAEPDADAGHRRRPVGPADAGPEQQQRADRLPDDPGHQRHPARRQLRLAEPERRCRAATRRRRRQRRARRLAHPDRPDRRRRRRRSRRPPASGRQQLQSGEVQVSWTFDTDDAGGRLHRPGVRRRDVAGHRQRRRPPGLGVGLARLAPLHGDRAPHRLDPEGLQRLGGDPDRGPARRPGQPQGRRGRQRRPPTRARSRSSGTPPRPVAPPSSTTPCRPRTGSAPTR